MTEDQDLQKFRSLWATNEIENNQNYQKRNAVSLNICTVEVKKHNFFKNSNAFHISFAEINYRSDELHVYLQ